MAMIIRANQIEVFKSRSSGAIALFDEVKRFIKDEFNRYGTTWIIVDITSNDQTFSVILEEDNAF